MVMTFLLLVWASSVLCSAVVPNAKNLTDKIEYLDDAGDGDLIDDKNQNSNYSVEYFLSLLNKELFDRAASLVAAAPASRQNNNDLNGNYQSVINNLFSQLTATSPSSGSIPSPQNDFAFARPPPINPPPPSNFAYPPPYPPRPYPQPPKRPPLPFPPPPGGSGYRPPFNYGPPNSLIASLESISRYDDLRCVPRLLCEVTSGGRVSPPPPTTYLSRDSIVTLLTVLNFVDDSPLLMLARAAFLGYSSIGNIRACFAAYPTCPRDPNQLIDYLNNHNGGFFRFFNQQLAKQGPHYQHVYSNRVKKQNNNGTTTFPKYDTQNHHHHHPQRYPSNNARILNDPVDIVNYVTASPTDSSVTGNSRRGKITRITFKDIDTDQNSVSAGSGSANDDFSSVDYSRRRGKRITFPKGSGDDEKDEVSFSSDANNPMRFPDRTGTGNLILTNDVDGHYKIVSSDDIRFRRRKMKKMKFFSDNDQHNDGEETRIDYYGKNRNRVSKKVKFPEDEN